MNTVQWFSHQKRGVKTYRGVHMITDSHITVCLLTWQHLTSGSYKIPPSTYQYTSIPTPPFTYVPSHHSHAHSPPSPHTPPSHTSITTHFHPIPPYPHTPPSRSTYLIPHTCISSHTPPSSHFHPHTHTSIPHTSILTLPSPYTHLHPHTPPSPHTSISTHVPSHHSHTHFCSTKSFLEL